MRAAVVSAYGTPPAAGDFPDPAGDDTATVVAVEAAGLSRLVRAQVAGLHYSMSQASHPAPFVPGMDGIGRTLDGRRVYFAFPRFPFGAMAERTLVPVSHLTPVPETVDPVHAAALANPAMSSWAALTRRARIAPGETVWVLGATGASGMPAIRIARILGAGRVVALGRGEHRRAPMLGNGADAWITTDTPDLPARIRDEARAAPPAIILDYLWGQPAADIMTGLVQAHGAGLLRWVQIGALAGDPAPVPASLLRAAPVTLMGSGLGSVPAAELVAAVGELMGHAAALPTAARAVALDDITAAWKATGDERMVVVP